MQKAVLNGVEIAYVDLPSSDPDADKLPILLIHGFASSAQVNWVSTGWTKALTDAGYRVIAIDNRGHGESAKPHDETMYQLRLMASDSIALIDHLGIRKCHLMGYSMGARISARLMIDHGDRFEKVIMGGHGSTVYEGSGDWTPVREALLADSLDSVTDLRGRAFRLFADQTGSDRKALAACLMSVRELISKEELATIANPVLVAIGTEDEVAGSGEALAAIIPDARYLPIPKRDHMRATGDKVYIQGVLEFLNG